MLEQKKNTHKNLYIHRKCVLRKSYRHGRPNSSPIALYMRSPRRAPNRPHSAHIVPSSPKTLCRTWQNHQHRHHGCYGGALSAMYGMCMLYAPRGPPSLLWIIYQSIIQASIYPNEGRWECVSVCVSGGSVKRSPNGDDDMVRTMKNIRKEWRETDVDIKKNRITRPTYRYCLKEIQ